MHPEVREDVKSLIPAPDLAAMEERLNQFKKNIYKVSVPTVLYSVERSRYQLHWWRVR
jgi:transposase-like protein